MSGGLDSTTVATLAVKTHGSENVVGLSLFYGQKHEVELLHAKWVADCLRIRNFQMDISQVFKGTEMMSALMSEKEVPRMTYKEMAEHEGPMATYVPMRNSVLLSIAACRAMILGCDEVWIGVHGDDAHHDAYPDCRPDFIGALGAAFYIGSYNKVKLIAPVNHFSKAQVVRLADEIGAPLDLSYSCYNGTPIQCGVCPTCLERKEAFTKAGVMDPTTYME
jgi:7-cyano-7-deazaguanine synthase